MYSSKGLNGLINFPTPLANGLVYLDMGSNDLDNKGASRLLEWVAKSSFNTLQTLLVDYNVLTQIPTQIPDLVALNSLDISGNQILSIGNGAMRFTTPVLKLYVSKNNISIIHPGAFQGIFGKQVDDCSIY